MKMRLILDHVGWVVGSMLPAVVAVIALLTCNLYAASIQPTQPSQTRQDWQDLDVITLDSKGDPAKTVYYSYAQLLTLPTVTVKTERDPNTNTSAADACYPEFKVADKWRSRIS